MIMENKIKWVTCVKRCGIFTVLHIPPKMFVYYNFREKLDISQNQQKYEMELKYKLYMKKQVINDSCDVFDVLEWENRTNTHNKIKNP